MTCVRLTEHDSEALDAIMDRAGLVSRSAALRYVLRQYARANGLAPAKARASEKRGRVAPPRAGK